MSAVDDALERAENDPPAESWRAPMAQVVEDRTVLAAEVKRLRAESVHAPAALYGRPGREPICDFDCGYCRKGDDDA